MDDAGSAVSLLTMDRAQLAKECLRVERAGGSVREFLREAGFISPWGTWWRLQKEELGRNDLQITDGKGGGANVKKVTLEDKKKAVEIAIVGGNPIPYLKECGSRNPEALWSMIRRNVKEKDPELYAKIPARVGGRKKEETTMAEAMEGMQEAAETFFGACGEMGLDMKKGPASCEGFEVTGLKTEYGRFSVSSNGYLLFSGPDPADDLEMPAETWLRFAGDLPRVLEILGIGQN